MKVPGFLLKRLYVKGSLRNTPQGFEFKLKNTLGSGYAQGLLPMSIDGAEIPLADCTYSVDGKTMVFNQVTKESPATLAMNKEATIAARGKTLAAGPHKISMGFQVAGLGQLTFDLTDELSQ
jgi:hypothetical protein